MYTEASDMPWFGELAVWLNKPQGGTAKALMHTSCLALRHDDFLRFVQIMPEFRSCLNKILSKCITLRNQLFRYVCIFKC